MPRGLAGFRAPPRGNNGQCVQNCERDFHSKVAPVIRGYFGIHPYLVNIELKGPDDLVAREHKVACLPPHELFAALWGAGETQDTLF